MQDITTYGSESPFDQIKKVRKDGSEFWSARDLMTKLGYDRWENMRAALDRAIATATNQGNVVNDLFRGVTKKSQGRPREDVELARFACYLVAMNGDPRKPEVAAAQSYFAVKTREAETAPKQLTGAALMAAALQEADRTMKALETRAEESETKLDMIEGTSGFSIRQFHKHYFPDVPEREFFELLYKKRLLIDQRGTRGRDKNGKVKNGYEHKHPAAAGKPFFFLDSPYMDQESGRRYYQTKVRPGRPETDLAQQLATWGLAPNPAHMKEITA